MVRLELNDVGKRYRREWIFRGLNLQMEQGQSWALLGHNGSGKSTLLRILSGHLSPSKGKVVYTRDDQPVDPDLIYRSVSIAAPYIDLIEEFTLLESIRFHARFKPYFSGYDTKELLDLLQLPGAKNKEVRFFSSGMKQRLKLLLAFASDTPVLLLDEPTTNLDRQGVEWYKELIRKFSKDRLLIIASNVQEDIDFCQNQLEVTGFKG